MIDSEWRTCNCIVLWVFFSFFFFLLVSVIDNRKVVGVTNKTKRTKRIRLLYFCTCTLKLYTVDRSRVGRGDLLLEERHENGPPSREKHIKITMDGRIELQIQWTEEIK